METKWPFLQKQARFAGAEHAPHLDAVVFDCTLDPTIAIDFSCVL